MGFTTPCIIRKNTKELRNKLKDLGYNRRGSWNINTDVVIQTLVQSSNEYLTFKDSDYKRLTKLYNNHIDCVTNEELFLAIAALRDDSDINQWFILQYGSWGKCECESIIDMWGDFDEEIGEKYPRKATVEELIEHFK